MDEKWTASSLLGLLAKIKCRNGLPEKGVRGKY